MRDFAAFDRGFLSSKLNPPATTPAQIPRLGVWSQVRACSSAKLIVVRAPAGYGKTTAMIQCRAGLEESGVETAWMTLDRADNDVSRFLACLAAAVAGFTGEAIDQPGGLGRAAVVSPADIAFRVIERLARHPSPFALFLDDFESVQEPTVLQLTREILDHLPGRGQLIIGSRSLPELGLERLRARGQLLEIDSASLRFSMAETTEFISRNRGLMLPDDDLSTLHRKTEGWIAALSLASAAIARSENRTEFIARFSGSTQAVARYLAEDVLASQPPDIRDFLLRTSILRQLSESLCEALLPHGGCATILRRLEDASLFLTPVDGDHQAYRYHSLFAAFLRDQLLREAPDEFLRLHRAASEWYEAQGRPVPAIDHALEARDFGSAMRLLAQHAEDLLEQGRMRLLARWCELLPPDLLQSSQWLRIVRVWALCFTRGPQEAMAELERSGCAESKDPKVLAHVLALRPTLMSTMDRTDEAYALSCEALSRLPPGQSFAERALANETAYTLAVMGRSAESHELLDAARGRYGIGRSAFHGMYAESIEGILALEEGWLRKAVAHFRLAVDPARVSQFRNARGNAWAGLLYAGVLYELNDLAPAAQLQSVYLPLARDSGLPDHILIGYRGRSRLAFLRGDAEDAFRSLTELEYLGHDRGLPRVVCSARLERGRVLLMQGHLDAARAELDRANDRAVWERVRHLHLRGNNVESYELADLRWRVFAGETDGMIALLERTITAAMNDRRHYRAMKLRVLQSIAYGQLGERRAALATMNALLRTTCIEGFVRLIADEGERAGALVRQIETSMRDGGSGPRDPAFSDYLHKLLDAFGDALPPQATDVPGKNVSIDALTAKEIRILSLLAEGYSNAALAQKLFISDSTVRTHLRNINGKLNAQNRTQAVALARRLGVIRSDSPLGAPVSA